MASMLVFGEAVWDGFPDGDKLGGAPLNFAYHFLKAGGSPTLLSAVGNDSDGRTLLDAVARLGLETTGIEIVNEKPTGRVKIWLEGHRHRFSILRDCAWETISLPKGFLGAADALYLGSLSRISPFNIKTSNALLESFEQKPRFFDMNLRKPHFDKQDLDFVLRSVSHVKMNRTESQLLTEMDLIVGEKMDEKLAALMSQYPNLKMAVITLGAEGAISISQTGVLLKGKGLPATPGGDAVGAGDAFFAHWAFALLNGMNGQFALEKGMAAGSIVASQRGAI